MNSTKDALTGGCLCNGVRYKLSGALRPVVACHCQQCQKTSGHFVAATATQLKDFELTESASLRWYRSSASAERGFCNNCGGNLFWKQTNSENISIFAGTLDHPSGLQLAEHIYVSDKADYYDISDALPQHAGSGITVSIK